MFRETIKEFVGLYRRHRECNFGVLSSLNFAYKEMRLNNFLDNLAKKTIMYKLIVFLERCPSRVGFFVSSSRNNNFRQWEFYDCVQLENLYRDKISSRSFFWYKEKPIDVVLLVDSEDNRIYDNYKKSQTITSNMNVESDIAKTLFEGLWNLINSRNNINKLKKKDFSDNNKDFLFIYVNKSDCLKNGLIREIQNNKYLFSDRFLDTRDNVFSECRAIINNGAAIKHNKNDMRVSLLTFSDVMNELLNENEYETSLMRSYAKTNNDAACADESNQFNIDNYFALMSKEYDHQVFSEFFVSMIMLTLLRHFLFLSSKEKNNYYGGINEAEHMNNMIKILTDNKVYLTQSEQRIYNQLNMNRATDSDWLSSYIIQETISNINLNDYIEELKENLDLSSHAAQQLNDDLDRYKNILMLSKYFNYRSNVMNDYYNMHNKSEVSNYRVLISRIEAAPLHRLNEKQMKHRTDFLLGCYQQVRDKEDVLINAVLSGVPSEDVLDIELLWKPNECNKDNIPYNIASLVGFF